jgi:hypothetical protein
MPIHKISQFKTEETPMTSEGKKAEKKTAANLLLKESD